MRRDWQNIRTGHAAFDKAVDYVGTGNVSSNVQFSAYIRPATDTKCNGFEFKPGELRAADLKPFGHLPRELMETLLRETETAPAILYKFRHRGSGNGEVVHGYVLTRTEDGHYERIATHTVGHTVASERIIQTMMECVSNPPGTAARLEKETVPAQIKAIDDFLVSLSTDLDTAMAFYATNKIASLIGSDPDIGVSVEGYNARGEIRNLWRAIADQDEHYARFSVAGTEALAKARGILKKLNPSEAQGVQAIMKKILEIASDEAAFGYVDPDVTMTAYVRKIAALENTPKPRC